MTGHLTDPQGAFEAQLRKGDADLHAGQLRW
jgi:hypothetical protein